MEINEREYSDSSCGPIHHLDRRIRREIANSNERRRMKNINNGFDDLKQLVCKDSDEKISKAGVLRKTIDYLQILEEYNTLLIQQNKTLKRLLAESDKGELVDRFSSPVKRKLCDNNSRKVTKCKKINLESGPNKQNIKIAPSPLNQIYDLRSGREQIAGQNFTNQIPSLIQKHETTPSHNEESFPFRNARRSLDSIIEAINQLEGEERINRSFSDSQ